MSCLSSNAMGCVNTMLNIVTIFDWIELTDWMFWSIDTAAKGVRNVVKPAIWYDAKRQPFQEQN